MALVIDSHVHVITGTPGNEYLPPRYRWQQSINWAYQGRRPPYDRDPMDLFARQEERIADPTGAATVAGMDAAGVDASVLIHAEFGLAYGEPQPKSMEEMHQEYTDIANRYPGRFYPFAGPDVRRPGALELVQQGLQDGRFKGLKVMPEMGYFVSDPMLLPFYDTNLDAGTPVAICTNFEAPFARARFNDPIHLTDVVADFPDLNVINFHAGYPFEHWFEISLVTARSALNVYLEFDSWMRPSREGEEARVRRLARTRDTIGAHRIIFGSDTILSPTNRGRRRAEEYVEQVVFWKNLPEIAARYGVKFSQEEVDLMLGLNLARLLKIVDMPEYEKQRKYGWKIVMPRPSPTP